MDGYRVWREGDLWTIDVPDVGVTQAESEADIPRMANALVADLKGYLPISDEAVVATTERNVKRWRKALELLSR